MRNRFITYCSAILFALTLAFVGLGSTSQKASAINFACSNGETISSDGLLTQQEIDKQCSTQAACKTHDFLGIPPWYKYLTLDKSNDCHPTIDFDNHPDDIWKIGAALIEILLRLGGLIVVMWIILTGFMFMTSNGNPDAVKQVRNRLIYAGVGLAIIILSASFVSFIGRRLTRAPTSSLYQVRSIT